MGGTSQVRERGTCTSGGAARAQPQGAVWRRSRGCARGQGASRWKQRADLGVGQRPRRLSPVTHSHFQALGSAQAPGNSFHLLSLARPLTLCSHLPSSRSGLAETSPGPGSGARLHRWGINPPAVPLPALPCSSARPGQLHKSSSGLSCPPLGSPAPA